MSVGRPPANFSSITATPPDRGSFPLDHDGECKQVMAQYLKCLRKNKNDNTPCRDMTKQYLACRMDHGLMERADWADLGFAESKESSGKGPQEDR